MIVAVWVAQHGELVVTLENSITEVNELDGLHLPGNLVDYIGWLDVAVNYTF